MTEAGADIVLRVFLLPKGRLKIPVLIKFVCKGIEKKRKII